MDLLNHVPSSRFLCPKERYENNKDHQITKTTNGKTFHPRKIKSSCFSEKSNQLHSLFCRRPDPERLYICEACQYKIKTNTYYFCSHCDKEYHKECVEAPSILHSPSHPRHPLQLLWCRDLLPNPACFSCPGTCLNLLYYCLVCDFALHVFCSKNPTPPLTIDNPKRHKHTLHYFPRKSTLACDVCGLVDEYVHILYTCLLCDFLVHRRCIGLPYVIKVSRHSHRLAFTPGNPFKEESADCGVCYQKIDINYGEYSCVKGCVYAMHSGCALRSDVSDGKELEGKPEEETYDENNNKLFEDKGDGVIHHEGHPCHDLMKIEKQQLHDHENKRCQACMLPLCDDDGNNVYRCIQHCDFFLHEACANLPRVKQCILHVHPLILELRFTTRYFARYYLDCVKCQRPSCGFSYVCPNEECNGWKLDTLCASIREPFNHHAHPHPLFITCTEYTRMCCFICKSRYYQPLSCVQCRFDLCFRCATLPHKVRYKHDEHLLVFSYKEDADDDEIYWCEICEEDIFPKLGFYACSECGVPLHIDCLLGSDLYMKPGEIGSTFNMEIHYLSNTYPTRPICKSCKRHCPYKLKVKTSNGELFCSSRCLENYQKYVAVKSVRCIQRFRE
ncbi:unnamed protein product [Eruca vesicaria subsp. sativa]|uniref:Zinc finger PHD-type domain-containing protein n=1 Tax=Eruca vesicaria subsp. sativa TaxID=29727 RepID=A0ABC8KZE5_ERUVS|nr:unnamed protein product [Eruca vesicaria subsp. sativa]